MSIATALTALADDVSAAKAAITAKGGTAPIGTADMADAIAAIPSGGITPSGNINITENGTYDVSEYAEAVVDVSGGGDYPSIVKLEYTPSATTQIISLPINLKSTPIYVWCVADVDNIPTSGMTASAVTSIRLSDRKSGTKTATSAINGSTIIRTVYNTRTDYWTSGCSYNISLTEAVFNLGALSNYFYKNVKYTFYFVEAVD